MALKRLPTVLFAMSPALCFAEVDGDISDRINMEGLCLTAGSSENLYNGAPVSFTECSDDGAFWMHFDGHVDASQLFAIHVGTYRIGPTIGPFPPDPFSKWCLDSVDVDSNSSLVTIWECNDSPQQHFKLSSAYDTSGVAYEGTISLSDGKCLDGTNAAAGNAPTAQICNGGSEQVWGSCRFEFTTSGGGGDHDHDNCDPLPTPAPTTPAPIHGSLFHFKSAVSSLCVDLPGGDTSNGALLWTWECDSIQGFDGSNQQWDFQDGQLVYASDTSKCLDLLGGNSTNGNLLGLWDCNHGDSQLWGIDSNRASGTIYLASSSASDATKCIQIGGQNIGDLLAIWDCNGEEDQVWRILAHPFLAVV